MSRRPYLVRTLLMSAALCAAVLLAGCETDGVSIPGKALKELSPQMVAALEQKRMPKESPVLVRLFKEESELEIWKQDDTGRFALLKTYPICRWSGELGPKIKEGDRQAPEGFYNITPGQMNPNSQFYLAFNLGYPNAYDRANDRTGAHLMVHGDCSSRGCYAMTDDQISEIYALARESFFGGQKSFQVQAYPFRMNAMNMARHRNSPHLAFWKMLKKGYDHFEVSRLEPKVDVCEKRYVFDAEPPANASQALRFDPKGRCPVYEIPPELASAVQDKQQRDEQEFMAFANRGVATAPIRTNSDGGMHPSFLAKLKPREVLDADGRVRVTTTAIAPASMGNNVVPPRTVVEGGGPTDVVTADTSTTSSTPAATTAAAGERSLTSRLFGGLFRTASSERAPPPPPAESRTSTSRNAPKPSKPATTAAPVQASAGAIRPQQQQPQQQEAATAAETVQSRAWPGSPPQAQNQAPAAQQTPPRTATSNGSLMSGAQPALPSSSFDGRWGPMR